MAMYKVKFEGGGPKLQSNRKGEYIIDASNPRAAMGKAIANETELGFKLPKGAWVKISMSRVM